eukprot:5511106-Pyramimonas_sp.AAC.1
MSFFSIGRPLGKGHANGRPLGKESTIVICIATIFAGAPTTASARKQPTLLTVRGDSGHALAAKPPRPQDTQWWETTPDEPSPWELAGHQTAPEERRPKGRPTGRNI